jgi:hypothetical protein
MHDLSKKEGNPTHGLQQYYDELMLIENADALKTRALEIVESYKGHGISKKNYMKFKNEIAKCETLDHARFYVSNYICAGSGLGVI